jgi:hypothetical protein
MSVEIWTARMGYRGSDALPVTRRIVQHPDGLLFAPSEALLFWGLAERKAGRGEASWPSYRERYVTEMRASYQAHREVWARVLGQGRRVLLCFCTDPARCHRSVLAGLLGACGASVQGEVPGQPRGKGGR